MTLFYEIFSLSLSSLWEISAFETLYFGVVLLSGGNAVISSEVVFVVVGWNPNCYVRYTSGSKKQELQAFTG